MSRHASRAGCSSKNREFSPAEKQALLDAAAKNETLLLNNPMADLAVQIGPDAYAALAAAFGCEKIHIPSEQRFYQRIYRETNAENIRDAVARALESGKSKKRACQLAAQEFKVSSSWVRDMLAKADA